MAQAALPSADALDRTSVTLADGTEARVYHHPDLETVMPSVTTVVDHRLNPDKDEKLDGWRDHFDGSTKFNSPHHADQLAYKSARGTLGHFAILSQLADVERSDEEDSAEALLKNWGSQRPTVTDDDVDCAAPFGNPAHYEGEPAWDRCMRDVNWAIKQFEGVADEEGITTESVRRVEEYIYEREWGYAGQFDCLYEHTSGDLTLADLKLSSGVRPDYFLQLAAYAYALDVEVDRVQVIRLHPDSNEVEVVDNTDRERTVAGLIHQFLGLVDKIRAEKIRPEHEAILEQIES